MGKNEIRSRNLKMVILSSFALLSVVWSFLPEKIVFGSAPVCLHYRIFGVQCPFCGLSRAGYQMLHLNLREAWAYNPLIYYTLWLYTLEWMNFMNHPFIFKLRKMSLWIALVPVLIIYGQRISG